MFTGLCGARPRRCAAAGNCCSWESKSAARSSRSTAITIRTRPRESKNHWKPSSRISGSSSCPNAGTRRGARRMRGPSSILFYPKSWNKRIHEEHEVISEEHEVLIVFIKNFFVLFRFSLVLFVESFATEIRRAFPPRVGLPFADFIGVGILPQPILRAGDQGEHFPGVFRVRQFGLALFALHPADRLDRIAVDRPFQFFPFQIRQGMHDREELSDIVGA